MPTLSALPLLFSPYLLNSGPAQAETTLPPANIVNGKYWYTEDLLKLEAMAPPQPGLRMCLQLR